MSGNTPSGRMLSVHFGAPRGFNPAHESGDEADHEFVNERCALTTVISDRSHDKKFVDAVKEISGENFHKCMQCGTCSGTCPMTDEMNMTTRQFMLLTHLGLREKVMSADTAWYCAACQSCAVRCPRGIDIPRVVEAVRQVFLRENQNFVEPNQLSEDMLTRLPQVAFVSSFRKHTS